MDVSTIGLDLAKNVFQVHGVDRDGKVVIRRQVRRSKLLDVFASLPPCVVGMEACCSAHHWAREIRHLGHEVRLMPPHYVKPYVKRQKNDAADAEAICEAATRPSMRFVAIKGTEQQSVLVLHRTRSLLIRQRTMLVNALRSHFAEFGIVVAKGIENVAKLAAMIEDKAKGVLPAAAVTGLSIIVQQLKALKLGVDKLEKEIRRWHRKNPESRRLATIPGIGPITASAMSATIADPHQFKSGRHLAAWLGVVPRQNSSGGKDPD